MRPQYEVFNATDTFLYVLVYLKLISENTNDYIGQPDLEELIVRLWMKCDHE